MNIKNYDSFILEYENKYNDFVNNIELWENKKNKILHIFGYSGSGKSYLSDELSKQYNCKAYHTDELYDEVKHEALKIIDNTERQRFYKDFIYKKYNEILISNEFCIWEGTEIPYITIDINKDNKISKKSIIIKETSLLQSSYRRIKSEGLWF